MEFQVQTVSSLLGCIDLVAQSDALVSVDFSDCRDRMYRLLEKRFGSVSLKPGSHEYGDRLQDYFSGKLDAIDDVSVSLRGTAFQNRVWTALASIDAGQTRTYGELAAAINQPRAAQAVGRANSQNPILIFLPCHRVIGKRQQMVGYSAGIDRKAWLLHHEKLHGAGEV